jgi:hypothetical protein
MFCSPVAAGRRDAPVCRRPELIAGSFDTRFHRDSAEQRDRGRLLRWSSPVLKEWCIQKSWGVDGGGARDPDLAAGAFLREAALIEADPAAIACAKLLN